MSSLVLFNKPFNVLSQFKASGEKVTLKKYLDLPAYHPAGRLDYDSEGLLLLTDDGGLQHRITDPKNKEDKSYWVQVEGEINEAALSTLRKGVLLKDGITLPAKARCITEPEGLWQRVPPIRVRKQIPTSWLELTINEGRNRQVRRMTAAVGFPTLRLIRHRISTWSLEGLQPGEYKELGIFR
jgi:23S rRNA pseudouridine2457 synthase